jgi:hypothetical protein
VAKIPTFYVGNRNPAITETITIGGAPVNLTGASVQFRMRPLGSSTLKVDQPATITSATQGQVQYNWAVADVDTEAIYLCWWVVTTSGGLTQDVAEQVIEFQGHVPTHLYVEPEELKTMADIGGNYADDAVRRACRAASRGIDLATRRRFWLDPDATSVRTYTPDQLRFLFIDDLVAITSVMVDRTGDGVYEETWTRGTDYILEPQNAPVEDPQQPWQFIRCRQLRGRWFPVEIEAGAQITGQFGWQAIPEEIRTCAIIIATKLLIRIRTAPFGIVALGGLETGIAMRIARDDPDVSPLLQEYSRKKPF